MASNRIYLQVDFNSANADQQIKQLNRDIAAIGPTTQKTATQATGGIKSISVAVDQATSSFRGLGGVLAGLGLANLGKGLVDTVLGFEQARIGLEAFLGSSERAQQVFRDLQAFAEKSPFEFPDLLEGANRLLAFEFRAEELIPTLRAVSSAVAAVGQGDRGKLQDFITALGQIKSAGRLTGEELRQLRNVGVPAVRYLAEAYGKTTAEMEKLIRQGLIPADEAIRAIVAGTTQQFGKFDEAISKTGTVAISNFVDTAKRMADDVAGRYLPSVTDYINGTMIPSLRGAAEWWKQWGGEIETVAKIVAVIVAGGLLYKFAAGIEAITLAVKGLTAASALNPWGLAAIAIGSFAYAMYDLNEKQRAFVDGSSATRQSLSRTAEEAAKLQQVMDAQEKTGRSGGIRVTREFGGPSATPPPYRLGTNAEAAAKSYRDQLEESRRLLEAAQGKEIGGVEAVKAKYAKVLREITGLTEARWNVLQAREIEMTQAEAKHWTDVKKFQESAAKDAHSFFDDRSEQYQRLADYEADRFRQRQEFQQETLEMERETLRARLEGLATVVEAERDRKIAELKTLPQDTLEQKIAIERDSAQVEIATAEKVHEIRMSLLQEERDFRIRMIHEDALSGAITMQQFTDRYRALMGDFERKRAEEAGKSQSDLDRTRLESTAKVNDMIRDDQRRTYEQIKDGAGRVFDALLDRSTTVWEAMANSFKTIILTALREVVSSQIARLFVQLLGGGSASAASGGSGWRRVLGIGGSTAASAAGTAAGGGTGTFGGVGLAGLGGVGGLAAAGGALGLIGAYKAGQSSNPVLKGFAPAFGAAAGLFTFGALAYMFPALLAAGPVGWIAAAGIGAVIGLIGIFRKSADSKVREKLKQVYGVDVAEKSVRDAVLEIAKSKYGGNLDMAVRSPEVMEMMRLYQITTGKGVSGLARPMYGVTFQQSAAGTQQQPVYMGGTLVTSPYTGVTTAQSAPAPTPIVLQLDQRNVAELFVQGVTVAVSRNPGAVGQANLTALRLGINRNAHQSALIEPLTLMR